MSIQGGNSMEKNKKIEFLTIRQTAARGILPEHALRLLSKQNKLPQIKVGAKVLINFPKLIEQLQNL